MNKIYTSFLLIFLLFSVIAKAQGPVTPEVASFEPFDATDMVNLVSGDLSYVFPLLEVPGPEGGYPISLSYHAGIAKGQDASWVGLGWNLNPGVINRKVNGEPDDWKGGRQYDITYSNLGTQKITSIGLGAASQIFNAGLEYTFVNGKAYGGSVSMGLLNYGNTIGFGGKSGFSQNASIYGFNIGVNSGNVNISYMDFGLGLKYGKGGGFSLDNRGNSLSLGNIGFQTVNNNDVGKNDITSRSFAFGAMIPTGSGFFAKFNYLKSSSHIFKTGNYGIYGALYSADGYLPFQSTTSYSIDDLSSENRYMDVVSSFMSGNLDDTNSSRMVDINPHFLSYDDYYVSGEGILMNIQPKIYENGTLIGNSATGSRNGQYLSSKTPFEKSFSDEKSSIYFYNADKKSSFTKLKNNGWSVPNTISNITDITSGDDLQYLYEGNIGFDLENNRKNDGNIVRTYTNKQIIENDKLIFDVENFDRNDLDPSGIGAFSITVDDGKTYHYSLPVYQYENVFKYNDSLKGDDTFIEIQRVTPYATHWLLTAITGPDYFDSNSNKVIDDKDMGFWIKFDYGKWTDSFRWDNQSTELPNVQRNGRVSPFDYKKTVNTAHSWGVRELYYLNSISTRTHSAIFLKSERSDNLGKPMEKSWVYKDVDKNIYRNDENRFPPGVYLRDLDYYYDAKISSTTTLKLDKILLIKRSDFKKFSLDKSNHPTKNRNQNFIHLKIYGRVFDSAGRLLRTIDEDLHKREWVSGEYTDNVYLSKNFDDNLIKSIALKSYDLSYDYSSMVSSSMDRGKLTLNSLKTKGRNSSSFIPPHKFEYYNTNKKINVSDYDLWGYNKRNPENFSLKKIIDPLGGSLEIKYEKDDFDEILLEKNRVTHEYMTPVPISMNPISDRREALVEIVNTNPCAEIGQIYSCLNIGTKLKVKFVKSSYQDFIMEAKIEDISDNTLRLKFLTKIPDRYDGEFYIIPRRNGTTLYKVELIVDDCNSLEAIGKCDDSNGGLRVSKIINNSVDNILITSYDYTRPNTNKSSGITSQTPYLSFPTLNNIIPGPGVMYEYVTVSTEDDSKMYQTKTTYQFNTLSPLQDEIGFSKGRSYNKKIISRIGNYMSIDFSRSNEEVNFENSDFPRDQAILSNINIYDNYSLLGTVKSIKSYNSSNHLIKYKKVNYDSDPFGDKLGTSGESFKTYQMTQIDEDFGRVYTLTNTFRQENGSAVQSIENYNGQFSSFTNYKSRDFLTGNVLETQFSNEANELYRSIEIPAYKLYPNMGGTSSDDSNTSLFRLNMLSQVAANFYQVYDQSNWKNLKVQLQTWSPELYQSEIRNPFLTLKQVWREKAKYVWNGSINHNNGAFINYQGLYDDFNWDTNAEQQPLQWKKLSEVLRYNKFSHPLELKSDRKRSTIKYGDNDSKIYLTSDAPYNEVFYDNAEDSTVIKNSGDEFNYSSKFAHTGKYSIKIDANKIGFSVNPFKKLFYKISVWVRNENYQNVRLVNSGEIISFHDAEVIHAGEWTQLNFYIDISKKEKARFYLTSISGTVYLDDIRVFPVGYKVKTYIYNKFNDLEAVLDENNLGTKFEYDNNEKLTRIFKETEDRNSYKGGFKRIKEFAYSYGSEAELPTDGEDPSFSFSLLEVPSDRLNPRGVEAKLDDGQGEYKYRWAFSDNWESINFGNWSNQNIVYPTLDCSDYQGGAAFKYIICQVKNISTGEVVENSITFFKECR